MGHDLQGLIDEGLAYRRLSTKAQKKRNECVVVYRAWRANPTSERKSDET